MTGRPQLRAAGALAGGAALWLLVVAQSVVPPGWHRVGSLKGYQVRLDASGGRGGTACVLLTGAGKRVSFGNNRKFPVTGTTGWRRFQVVLDVPEDARDVAFGVHLNGNGSLWADDVSLDRVARR